MREKERVYTVAEGVLDELGDLAERLDVIRRLCDGCGEDTFRGIEIARLIAPDAKRAGDIHAAILNGSDEASPAR